MKEEKGMSVGELLGYTKDMQMLHKISNEIKICEYISKQRKKSKQEVLDELLEFSDKLWKANKQHKLVVLCILEYNRTIKQMLKKLKGDEK